MKKPILVTGAHRSGSTWTGKVIAAAKNVRYVHEPLNIGIERRNSPITHWYEYMSGTTSKQLDYLNYLNSFDSPFHKEHIKRLRNIRSVSDSYHYLKNIKGRLLIKDPLALMSAEWFYRNYNADVLITVRHPAAFVASIKLKNWQFDFENFLNQEELMKDYLTKYEKNIHAFAQNQPDIINQGILVWNILYDTVLKFRKKYDDNWYFIKHEDLSLNPLKEFREIFNFLDLEFDSKVKNLIMESTTSKTASKLQRDAKSNIQSWKKRLSVEEINQIKIGTREVWQNYYSEDDW